MADEHPDRLVETLFAEFLNRRDQGEEFDFDAFCAEHPEQADELRRLHEEWQRLRFSQSTSTHPQETVHVVDEQTDPEEWRAFLARLEKKRAESGRYQFRGDVAHGGMGAIVRVYDEDLRRNLAMKVILGKYEASESGDTPAVPPRVLGRFLEEAQVTAQLDHPGIVPVHELGVDQEGKVFFTMKLVKGDDLRVIFDKVKTGEDGWNQTRALNTILRAAEAMAFAHDRGVIHRDLKPANIMVGRFGEVYVMDWGLGRVLGQKDTKDLRLKEVPVSSGSIVQSDRKDSDTPDSPLVTMDGDVVGTPAYMSPEQAEGHLSVLGPHSDVYGMGAVIYELITGRMPYTVPGKNMSGRTILAQVLDGPPAPISKLNPNAPPELVSICEKAVAREVPDRYATMMDLAADLRAYLENRVVSAYATGAVAELKKWVKRNKALATTTALALIAVLALSGWAILERGTALENEQQARLHASAAEARKAEFDQLAGVVRLERALEHEAKLFPAWPEKIEAMERWLVEEAAVLRKLKSQLLKTIFDLQAWGTPLVGDEEQQVLSGKVESLRGAQSVRTDGAMLEISALPREAHAANAKELNEFAWPRVDWDLSTRMFGEEGQALIASRLALKQVEAGDTSQTKPVILDTLAWALFANGLDEDAIAASREATRHSSEWDKEEYIANQTRLEEAIGVASGEEGQEDLALLAALRRYHFTEELQQILYDTLSPLALEIHWFERDQVRDVEERLSWARRVSDLTLAHPNARVTWDHARAAIARADGATASERYAEHPIDLVPQTGLVPIGMNPVTKLWEFYHIRSACSASLGVDPAALEIPRHEKNGTIKIEAGTGIVFVLIPGSTFRMGAQSQNKGEPNYDPWAVPSNWESPVHEVTLFPFFLARHELTWGQWVRLKGHRWNPDSMTRSTHHDEQIGSGWTYPMESDHWVECKDLMRRHGLTLPTEAQWEYSARGGKGTVWWTGNDVLSVATAANVLDAGGAEDAFLIRDEDRVTFSDGFVGPAPVGYFRANSFGLHDVCGNVWEWCQDLYFPHTLESDGTSNVRVGDGLRTAGGSFWTASSRVRRGGGYASPVREARSASRACIGGHEIHAGVRPARDLMSRR